MLKNHEKELMISINLFLDDILKINNLFKILLQKYFVFWGEFAQNSSNSWSRF